jgi:hypothetical protein
VNRYADELCKCGTGMRLVHCRECFAYETSCGRCFVEKHRVTPEHWAYLWDSTRGFYEMKDYTAVLPEDEGISIQLCQANPPCSVNSTPLQFTLVHNNGIHSSRVRFCHCSNTDRAAQLLRMNLFPATCEQPETAFTFTALGTFRMHNLQSKVSAFDWIVSLRRMTEGVSSPKVAVSGTFPVL